MTKKTYTAAYCETHKGYATDCDCKVIKNNAHFCRHDVLVGGDRTPCRECRHETIDDIKERLEYLRGEILNESISTSELVELQSLAAYIAPDDVILLEWAGAPEHNDK